MHNKLIQRALPCAQWREGDGVDPRLEACGRNKRYATHKNQQLSKQVQRSLGLFLEGECRHPALIDIHLLDVQFDSVSQRLCVTVGIRDGGQRDLVLAALKSLQPALRSIIARAIHRKKVPTLAFFIDPSATGEE